MQVLHQSQSGPLLVKPDGSTVRDAFVIYSFPRRRTNLKVIETNSTQSDGSFALIRMQNIEINYTQTYINIKLHGSHGSTESDTQNTSNTGGASGWTQQ